jgi:hypothetical protein
MTALRERSSAPTVLVCALTLWLLGATRWGSYLAIPGVHVYISEWFIIAAVAVLIATGAVPMAVRRVVTSRQPLVWGMVALVTWSVIRLVVSGVPTMTGLRDFAPYGYAICGLMVFALPLRETSRWRAVVVTVIVFHAAWMTFAWRWPMTAAGLPALGQTQWLAIRYDVDSAVAGVAAGLAILYLPGRLSQWPRTLALLAFAAWNAVLAVYSTSRSGLLACVTVMGFAAAARGLAAVRATASHRRPLLAGAAAVLVVGALAAALASPGGQRLIESGTAGTGSHGTTHAREVVYTKVTHYITATPDRIAVGVGFGPDFLSTSHAAFFLEGTEYHGVRSPHDYELGTWARTGVVGLLITLWLAVFGVAGAWRQLRRPRGAVWRDMAALLAIAMPLVAAFGVVLESPFGAIPYFTALGLLAAGHREIESD